MMVIMTEITLGSSSSSSSSIGPKGNYSNSHSIANRLIGLHVVGAYAIIM